jgi:hypothetical protein
MTDGVFGTRLEMSEVTTRTVSPQDLKKALAATSPMPRVCELFLDHARDLAGRTGLHVLIVAPPAEVFAVGDSRPMRDREAELDEAQDEEPEWIPNFHDVFKARALELSIPCQIIRPDTYGGGTTRGRGRRKASLQDEATRAWNFHTALYYKAGGVPWRLLRQNTALATCYVGVSFFTSLDRRRLLTSVAQVFNERGEGLIVQGGNAKVDRHDLTAHISKEDARRLLAGGLASYRREHRTTPARVVVHKTTYFDQEEIEGCKAAADEANIEVLDLVSVRRAGVRLLRAAVPAVLRGTSMAFDEREGLIYLKGTVPYFRTYPGMYVPRALEFRLDHGESTLRDLAKEILELSKLNFNNTQFDSGEPITVCAARRVGDLLKHASADRPFQSRFRFFT